MTKNKANQTTHWLVQLALLTALMVAMDMTGLAMIPLPGQYASIATVPVAVGAMLLGPVAGGILGGVMGFISFFNAVRTGFATLTLAGYSGAALVGLSLANSLLPRVAMGFLTGWIFRLAKKLDKGNILCYYIGGLVAPLTNTILYMSILIAILLHAPTLEAALSPELMVAFRENILLFAAAYVGVQALIEAVLGCVISGSICKILHRILKK